MKLLMEKAARHPDPTAPPSQSEEPQIASGRTGRLLRKLIATLVSGPE